MIDLVDLRPLAGMPVEERPPVPEKALVFIHGIFSSHVTFEPLVAGLAERSPELARYGAYYFDYDFHQTIPASGRELAEVLGAAFPEKKPEVTLVGHSMGGLVARTALLQAGDLGMIKRLVMLGTPNHGTLHTARLGVLAHLVRETAAVLWTVFPRQATGIKELTQIGKTITPLLQNGGFERTRNVEYVSIPGLRFNEEAAWLEAPEGTSPGLRGLAILFGLLQAVPGMKAELRIPHDGIVEARCVQLSSSPEYFSERPAVGLGRQAAPYLHIMHPDYEAVDHVTIQRADRTISLLAELLAAPDLETWRLSLAERGEFNLVP